MELNDVMRLRRSAYALDRNITADDSEIVRIVEEALLHTPTGFNSQGPRAMLMLGKSHDRLWSITLEALRKIVPPAAFKSTEDKIKSFAAAYGTVLFFEDEAVVKGLQENYALYASNFPIWATQSNGMLQQTVWFGLTQAGLGASLQHYTELIEEEIRKEFDIPANWKMTAQMPFGNPIAQPSAKDFAPLENRFKVVN